MQVHKETQSTHGGGDITASGCWLSAAVLIKQRMGPERPVYGLMIEQSICLAEALHEYCIRQVVGLDVPCSPAVICTSAVLEQKRRRGESQREIK